MGPEQFGFRKGIAPEKEVYKLVEIFLNSVNK
jgi:hypothetical protein